jgi:ribosomal-protein-alanine N-acetyltransferase
MTTLLATEEATLPTLETGRLVLRAWTLGDAPVMAQLCNNKVIARYTTLPHPYSLEDAEKFIASRAEKFAEKKTLTLAITLRETGEVIGCIGVSGDFSTGVAELGYWIAASSWGKGYCTEAARAMVDYGFRALGLCRIHAGHFGKNQASGKVMKKVGLQQEGVRRQHLFRWGEYDDEVLYGMLKAEFDAFAKQ